MSAYPAPATWPRRLLVALGAVALLALLVALLFAWNRAALERAQAAGPGPGMSLDAPATVFEGLPFTLTVSTAPAPDVEIQGFGTEVVFPAELEWLPRPNCLGPGPDGEVQVERQDGGPIALCQSFLSLLLGGVTHAVISEFTAPPVAALNVTPGSTPPLLELDYVCNTPGTYKLTLTAEQDSPGGAVYGSTDSTLIFVKTVSQELDLNSDGVPEPHQVADTLAINCVSGPVPSPTPTALLTPPPATPTPPPCPLTPSGSPLPGMSLEAPATVSAGVPFTLCVNADPAPSVEISGFFSEVVFPDGLKWLPRACVDELQVGRLDGGAIALCNSINSVRGGAAHFVVGESGSRPSALDVAAGSTTTLVALDFTCNEVGSHKLTLTAYPDSENDGARYIASTIIAMKTVPHDYDGDTTPNEVADTLVIDCVESFDFNGTPIAVGGLQTALGPPDTSRGASHLTAVLATAVAAAALGGAAWYARRRLRRRSRSTIGDSCARRRAGFALLSDAR